MVALAEVSCRDGGEDEDEGNAEEPELIAVEGGVKATEEFGGDYGGGEDYEGDGGFEDDGER